MSSAMTAAPTAMVTIPGWVVEELVQPAPRSNGHRAKPYWVGRCRVAVERYPTAQEAIDAYRKLQRRAAATLGQLRARATTLHRPVDR